MVVFSGAKVPKISPSTLYCKGFKMNNERTEFELDLLARVRLLEAEKVQLENWIANARIKIARLKARL